MRLARAVLPLVLALLGACGGGGGEGGSTAPRPSPTALSGIVAANVALAGYTAEVLTRAGPDSIRSGGPVAGPDGRYNAILSSDQRPPFVLRASRPVTEGEPQYPRLYSITNGAVGNVTPLTSLLVARLLNRKPSFFIDSRAVFELQDVSDAQLAATRGQVVAYLLNRPSKDNGNVTAPVDVSGVIDFVAAPLTTTPGDPYFEALRRLHASLMDSETIEGVEEHMLFRDDPPADLRAMLALDFAANCTIEGIDDSALPRGTTRIVFDRRGITFGNLDFPFFTGDLVTVTAGQTAVPGWQFESSFRQTRVDLNIDAGRLDNVVLSRPIGVSATRCFPIGEVSVSGKHPSLIGLIRLLGQSLASPAFQCAGPVSVGFQVGTNLLNLEQNGALRINGRAGPSLHLPSQNVDVTARLTMLGGEVAPIRLSSFGASRVFQGGFDSFSVALGTDGRISGLSLGRQNPRSTLSQRCGTV